MVSERLKPFIKRPILATYRVDEYQTVYTKKEISEILEISRPTLYLRLAKHNWTMAELQRIDKHFPELSN